MFSLEFHLVKKEPEYQTKIKNQEVSNLSELKSFLKQFISCAVFQLAEYNVWMIKVCFGEIFSRVDRAWA